jgi:hypothetical protein
MSGSRAPRFLRALAFVLICATLPTALGAVAPARGAPSFPYHRTIAPGIVLTTYIDRRVPIRAYVLTIDPSQGASIGTVLASGGLGSLERPSSMAKAAGAIAAINGDFGSEIHRPTHPFAAGGDLVQTSPVLGGMFSVSSDGSMRIGRPTESVTATEIDTGETWPVSAWNYGRPTVGELMAYTSSGGNLEKPRSFTCSARMLPAGPTTPTDNGDTRTYTVDQSACASSSMNPREGVVISAEPGTDEATFVRSLSHDESIRIDWSLGWPGVTDAIGGDRVLVDNGQIVLDSCTGGVCARNPRTSIGLTADGRVLLVVVDGRQSTSVGMSMIELATFMAVTLGAQSAINLDGGGSSVMVIKGRIVNHLSDGFERSLTNAVVVRSR